MNFIDALTYLYQNRTSDEEFCNAFLLYSKLSDLCGASYEDKRKVLLFYQVNKKISLVRLVLDNDENIASRYQEVANLLSESSFQNLVKTVQSVVFSENTLEKNNVKMQKRVEQKAVIIKAEEPEVTETRTPLTPSSATTPKSTRMREAVLEFLFGLIIFVVLYIGIILLIEFIFGFKMSWTAWQWTIGILSSMILFDAYLEIVDVSNEIFVDFCVAGTIVLGCCIIINFILLLIFRHDYKILFGWFSAFEFIASIMFAIASFDDLEEGFGAIQIIESILAVILFIIAMTCV